MIEYFETDKVLLAIVIRREYSLSGIEFFTKPTESLQIGQMGHPKGHIIRPHMHKPVPRRIDYTNEVLLVKRGKVKVTFYNIDRMIHANTILKEGDIILLAGGGHGFEMLEDSDIFEVKQGPYAAEEDKFHF